MALPAWDHMPMQVPEIPDAVKNLPTKAHAWLVLGATLGIALVVAVGLAELFSEILEAVAEEDGVALWDRPLLDWMIARRTPGFTSFVAWYSNTGGPVWQPIVTGIVAIVLSWRWRDITPLILTVIAAGGSLLMTVVGKDAIGRARPPLADAVPPHETSMSFPSGHSLNAIVIIGILAYLLIRHLWDRPAWLKVLIGVLAAVYAVTMGLTRVYLGHHWFTDVLAAWVLGLAWLAVVIACHRVWRAVSKRTKHLQEQQKAEDRGPGHVERAD